jgi:hypothetical protein
VQSSKTLKLVSRFGPTLIAEVKQRGYDIELLQADDKLKKAISKTKRKLQRVYRLSCPR